ncbi:acrosomal protein KIAA1210 homolog [Passerculus sandwichensis]
MATRPTEVTQSPGDSVEECTGKKKSKFQTFKNFFAKKKRKEPPAPRGESNLKPCQSSSDVSIAVLDTAALHSPGEAGPKGSMGNKALSHDSVFILESAPGNVTGDVLSQENRPGRVRTLQLQLQQNVKLGSPPLVITGKKLEDAGAVSEDDGLPRSPPEISTLHGVLTDSPNKSSNPVQRHSSLSLGGTDSEDEQIPSGASSRPISPSSSGTQGTPVSGGSSSLPVDFTSPASPLGCLDTSAARHRIAINPRRHRGFTSKHLLPLQELGSLPGVRHPYKGATLLLRPEPSPVNLQGHHSAGVMCSADGSAHESKTHPQSTSAEAPARPELQQLEGEAAVSPDIPTADSFSFGVETSGMGILPGVAPSSSVNSVDSNINAQEKGDPLFSGKEELCFGTAGNHSSHAVSDAPQAAVADTESCSDIKKGADLRSEKSSVAKNDKETCEIMEFQLSKDSEEKKIDPAASVSEAVCVVPCSKLEVCSKAEMVPASKGNQGSQQGNTSCISGKLSIGCLASSSLAGLKSNISSDAESKEHQVSTAASHRKAAERSQSSDENVQTPLKTASARPVRFTIAPAWQRSLSGGSNSKEDSYSRSSPTSPIRPEFFEGMTKEPSRFDAALQESAKTNSERFDRDCKDRDLHLNSFMEWADHETQNFESPFGVRLRRTSSLLKYQNESRVKPLKLLPPAAPAAASASVKEDQKLMGTGKPPPSLPVHTKSVVKKPDLLEDKNPAKARSEEVAKKQNGYKPSEKVSPDLETASSEPAWVSMAKLKRKGFQDHPLAKEHKDKALAKVDQGEPGLCAGENALKKRMPPSSQDKKTQRETGVSAAAGKFGPMSQEASVVPAVGKEARHSPTLPMTPCSPAEPPWLSLAKKKAKAWSEMPQIVQ